MRSIAPVGTSIARPCILAPAPPSVIPRSRASADEESHTLSDRLRKAGDSSGFALGMTPHPSPPSATPPSPQGEGLADRPREEGVLTPALPSPPPFDETLFRCVVERVTVSRAETVFTFRDGSAIVIPRP